MRQRELPLVEAVVVLRDGTLHREHVARLSMIEEVRVYGRNHRPGATGNRNRDRREIL